MGFVVLFIGFPIIDLTKQRPCTRFTAKEELWVLCV